MRFGILLVLLVYMVCIYISEVGSKLQENWGNGMKRQEQKAKNNVVQIVINIPDTAYRGIITADHAGGDWSDDLLGVLCRGVANGTLLPKGHGKLKDEDEIVKSIENRVEFLRNNDAIFRRLRKDIDILGCIPKIRCEVPTIIEADQTESENKK